MKIAMGNDHAGLADYILPASLAVASGEADRGIFVDGVGFGSAMIANKLPGVYAAICQDPYCAKLSRWHCDCNVLCLGGKIIGSVIAMEIVKDWMAEPYWGEQE